MGILLNRKGSHKKVERSWGTEEWITNGIYCCKQMMLRPLHWSSLHFHMEKRETFWVQSPIQLTTVQFHEKDLAHFRQWGKLPDISECEGRTQVKHRGADFIVPGIFTKTYMLNVGDSIELEPYMGHYFTAKENGLFDIFPFIEISTTHRDEDVYRILEGGPKL